MANIIDELTKPLELIAPLPLESEFDMSLVTGITDCNVGIVCKTGKFE